MRAIMMSVMSCNFSITPARKTLSEQQIRQSGVGRGIERHPTISW